MALLKLAMFCGVVSLAMGQRGSFAGKRPIGYPIPENITTTTDGLANKFGEESAALTERLPLEALGDRDLVNRISKLPVDQQPFWYINWQALEAQRRNPQTYPQRPSQFLETNQPSPISNSNSLGNRNSVDSIPNQRFPDNSQVANRNGFEHQVSESNKNKVEKVHQTKQSVTNKYL